MKPFVVVVSTVVVTAIVAGAGMYAFAYSGIYDIGADSHHTKPVAALIGALRERSIKRRASDLVVPNLEDPALILKGAGQYAAMCTGCHLAPGMAENEMRPGLYPRPPNLSKFAPDAGEAFWVIKHGIKMSAMPAWGATHDDPTIWSMVAFLQKMHAMTPEEYQDIVARAPADDDMHMGEGGHHHSHGDGADEGEHGAAGVQGMEMSGTAAHNHAAAAEDGHAHGGAAATVESVTSAAATTEAPVSLAGLKPQAVPAAEAVARAFQTALHSGDRAAVLALLVPEVTVSEGGHTQSHDEYARDHLGEDIAFLKEATITPISLGSMPMGDTAMVGGESEIKATIKGKPTTLRSREMLTLRQEGGAWKITSIRWQTAPESGK